MFYTDGNKYIGEWICGKREGFGYLFFADGDCFQGDWKNNKREGHGIYQFSEGARYEGNFVSSMKEGRKEWDCIIFHRGMSMKANSDSISYTGKVLTSTRMGKFMKVIGKKEKEK